MARGLEPEPVCDLRDGELRRIEQLFGTQEPDLREILRRRGSGILPEHLAEPRIADRQAFGDPLRRETALDLALMRARASSILRMAIESLNRRFRCL